MEAPSGQGCPIRVADNALARLPPSYRQGFTAVRRPPTSEPTLDISPPPRRAFGDSAAEEGRPPAEVLPGLWLFAPNRDTQGGSAWWVETATLALLIDCPALSEANLSFLKARTARRGAAGNLPEPRIVLTSRLGHGRCRRWQEALGWHVLVQEQEAYLLPGVERLETFADDHRIAGEGRLLWTPGPTPGASVLHICQRFGMDGLFCGRLLIPVGPGRLEPLISRQTFHAPRLLQSVERLRSWLPSGSPQWIASGAGLGALRGDKLVFKGATMLAGLDLTRLAEG